MTELLYADERMEKAVAFCWETQRMLNAARFQAWPQQRLREYVKSRSQLWRRFPAGIRTSAHYRFMDELKDELRKPLNERNPHRPVWLNEQLGITADDDGTITSRTDGRTDAGSAGGIIATS